MTLLQEVNQLALTLMNTTFIYNGTSYNMNDLGWKFKFNNNKRRLGLCRSSRSTRVGTLFLSKWIIENSLEPIETWEDTMLHEIAHAIDITMRGRSDHGLPWILIAKSIGCNGERTKKVNFGTLDKPISKYTLKCNVCTHEIPSHKKKRRTSSCGKCHPGSYNEKYKLEQVQNY